MKTTILILSNLISIALFSQENPWALKGENPWKTNPNNENVESEVLDTIVLVEEKIIISETKILQEEQSIAPSQKLLDQAESKALFLYESRNDFGAGFGFGLFFNLFGFIPDVVYIAVNTNNEKQTIAEIENDSMFVHIDKKVIEKEIKPNIKAKKTGATIGGTIVGSLTQIVVLAVITILTF